MSYILDALNKSERERARKRAPDLHALGASQPAESIRTRHFLAILVVVVVINAAAFWYFFGDRAMVPAAPTPVVVAEKATDVVASGRIPDVVSVEATSIDQPMAINALPAEVRQRLPLVEVTAHIYADDSELRMVKIDGVSRKEGEQIRDGLDLIKITETGVILKFENYSYRFDIVEDWQVY